MRNLEYSPAVTKRFGEVRYDLSEYEKAVVDVAHLLWQSSPAFRQLGSCRQQLLVTAMQKADIFHDQASPFELDLEFVA